MLQQPEISKVKKKRETNRNKVQQIVQMKDGSQKIVHHTKKWPTITRKQLWDLENTSPKPNSKRQRKLNGE